MSTWGRCQDRIWDIIEYNDPIEKEELIDRVIDIGFDEETVRDCLENYLEEGDLFFEDNGWVKIR